MEPSEAASGREPPLEYIGFWLRAWASLIDTVLVLLLVVPLMLAWAGPAYFDDERLVKGWFGLLVEWIIPAVVVVLFWIARGATPGKLAISAAIVDADSGQAASRRQLVVRYLGYYLSAMALLAGFIWVAFDARKQGWHDKLAGTLVIRVGRSSGSRH